MTLYNGLGNSFRLSKMLPSLPVSFVEGNMGANTPMRSLPTRRPPLFPLPLPGAGRIFRPLGAGRPNGGPAPVDSNVGDGYPAPASPPIISPISDSSYTLPEGPSGHLPEPFPIPAPTEPLPYGYPDTPYGYPAPDPITYTKPTYADPDAPLPNPVFIPTDSLPNPMPYVNPAPSPGPPPKAQEDTSPITSPKTTVEESEEHEGELTGISSVEDRLNGLDIPTEDGMSDLDVPVEEEFPFIE